MNTQSPSIEDILSAKVAVQLRANDYSMTFKAVVCRKLGDGRLQVMKSTGEWDFVQEYEAMKDQWFLPTEKTAYL